MSELIKQRVKGILLVGIVLLLAGFVIEEAGACGCDPPCTGCKTCEAGVCITDNSNCHSCKECISTSSTHGECQYRSGNNCAHTHLDCTGCESCINCSCEDHNPYCPECGLCENGECEDSTGEECIGCENCIELCPEVFGFDEETDKAVVIQLEGNSECVEDAIETCPIECIRWEN